jgi:radical SAM/Cys-rich protein
LSAERQRQILGTPPGGQSFARTIRDPLVASGVEVFQVNLGNRCNLACRHCHVGAGPAGDAVMPRAVLDACLAILRGSTIPVIDVTGGAPELHPDFRWFLEECAALGRRLLVRTNCAVLLEESCRDLAGLYARLGVEVVTSIPSPDEGKTDRQRGGGTFGKVVAAMRLLNRHGYGREGSGLALDVVHNPTGAYLPGCQRSLEQQYRQALGARHGVSFTRLFCITNMPIGRYLAYLLQSENYEDYMQELVRAFNPAALASVMCRTMVSVGWDGTLYDCDFNQMLRLPVNHGAPDNILDFDLARLARRQIVVGNHCYGCTAGAGSSCQGAVVPARS